VPAEPGFTDKKSRREPMPPRLSTWKAKHAECQKAVDNVKAHYVQRVEELETENGRMRRALLAISSSQFKGHDWPEVYDRLLALACEGLGVDQERPATSV
jgi:hypothetical protein